jgi:glycine dehydrogenase
VRDKLARQLPGRLVGLSHDADGRPALRLALQTREQHIRREKATSNICTAQVLLAVVAACYAVYHGPDGLARIARRAHRMAAVLAAGLRAGGAEVLHDAFFDTVRVRVPDRAAAIADAAHEAGIALHRVDADTLGVSCSELTTVAHLEALWAAFGVQADAADISVLDARTADALPAALVRSSEYLTHPVFHQHRSETSLMRWLRRLADADLALDRTMIPLGSCTMKLNAVAEMEPITWPGFADLHPFAPAEDAAGTLELIADLERWLAELTGYAAVSLQPNAGSQGELAGLLAIAAYHRSRGEEHRDVCLIPASAHGTNAASAVMAGLRVVVVATGPTGDVDLDDLRAKIDEHRASLAALMITYPSTHGVYEAGVRDVCDAVHAAGGQVYVDGANLNALVGVARPGAFGGDVSHLNLHKTFCIPHGGGGPGVGPVAVAEHLAPFLPGRGVVGPVSAAPYGSPGVLPIPWAYLRLMGVDGLRRATLTAVAAANYVARPAGGALPGALRRGGGPGGPRVHPRPAGDHEGLRRDRRRRREAAGRLRPARADDVVPGGGHPDGGAHRERGPRGDRPLRRRHDRDPRGDRAGGRRGSGRWTTTRCAAPRTRRRAWPTSGTTRTAASWPPTRPVRRRACTTARCGRPSDASTVRTATATWCAVALPRRLSPDPGQGDAGG